MYLNNSYVKFTTSDKNLASLYEKCEATAKQNIKDFAGRNVLIEGGGTLVLTFPYKVGTSVKLEGKKWEYHGGTRK